MAVLDASKEMQVSNKYANIEHFQLQKRSLFSNVMSSSFHRSQTSSCIFGFAQMIAETKISE